jgi:hypothetical protein
MRSNENPLTIVEKTKQNNNVPIIHRGENPPIPCFRFDDVIGTVSLDMSQLIESITDGKYG